MKCQIQKLITNTAIFVYIFDRVTVMNSRFVGTALILSGLLFGSCSAGWRESDFDEWIKEREKTPHVDFRLIESSNGCDVSGAEVRFKGIDSVYTSWRGECRVYGHMGQTWPILISCERFTSVDTTVTLPNVVAETIVLRLTRSSQDSVLVEPVTCGYRSGWENAERAIAKEDAYIYRGGGLPSNFLRMDKETGLPLRGNWTCLVDDFIADFSAGHNQKVRLWIEQKGLPRYSKKSWLSDIVSPRYFYDSSRRAGNIAEVKCDSSGVCSPDSAYELKIVSASKEEGANYAYINIREMRSGNTGKERIFDDKKINIVKIAWGPRDSRIVIVHTKSNYFVYDLARCEELNIEWD